MFLYLCKYLFQASWWKAGSLHLDWRKMDKEISPSTVTTWCSYPSLHMFSLDKVPNIGRWMSSLPCCPNIDLRFCTDHQRMDLKDFYIDENARELF